MEPKTLADFFPRQVQYRGWDSIHHTMRIGTICSMPFMARDTKDLTSLLPSDATDLEITCATGFKDIYKQLIYEGDLVRDYTVYTDLYETPGLYENNRVVIPYVVIWDKEIGAFQLYNAKTPYGMESVSLGERNVTRDLKVIGNIYEGPFAVRSTILDIKE